MYIVLSPYKKKERIYYMVDQEQLSFVYLHTKLEFAKADRKNFPLLKKTAKVYKLVEVK